MFAGDRFFGRGPFDEQVAYGSAAEPREMQRPCSSSVRAGGAHCGEEKARAADGLPKQDLHCSILPMLLLVRLPYKDLEMCKSRIVAATARSVPEPRFHCAVDSVSV